jgi:hypothetical protein
MTSAEPAHVPINCGTREGATPDFWWWAIGWGRLLKGGELLF